MKNILKLLFIIFISFNVVAEDKPKEYYYKEIEGDITFGKKEAKNVVIEYYSLTCPHCAYFHKNVFPEINKEFIEKGEMRYIVRDFPLNLQALKATILARCEGNERYNVFTKVLLEKLDSWAFVPNYLEILENIGKLGGIPADKIQQCFNDKALEAKIAESRYVASKILNINATPSFIINGKIYEGLGSFEQFKSAYIKNKIN